ncbi:serine/threonine-protein kinase [Rhodococcus sp. OK302]|uniref:serine/threonine-protein kinase n=1 Tax=Rhodococcus sp. OK302 TaxID=1882769 RepID=UPI000B93B696|nr:serine/threonine-protein kinase [Rhodococcus sp. OK302]OYD70976.1 serine/threonine-protein kinase [Rhodococcus sp. OK302]
MTGNAPNSPDGRSGTRFGVYELRRLLGRGGMGEVYEAYDTSKDRLVALKLLHRELAADPSFQARFRRESRLTAALNEPHVIPVHDWGEIDGVLYIDMRLVDGHTLRAELAQFGKLEPARAVDIVSQIAAGLDAAHANGLIHRDVKPDNIILTGAGFAYLVDFGIAYSHTDTKITTEGSAIGSYAYMAPERFGIQAPTAAADVYALACVLYQSLTGTTPFNTSSIEHLVNSHLNAPPPRPTLTIPALPPLFDAIIARGMAKDPAQRYATTGDLAREAQQALLTSAQSARTFGLQSTIVSPPSPTMIDQQHHGQMQHYGPPVEARKNRMPIILGAAAAALLLAAGGTTAWVMTRPGTESPIAIAPLSATTPPQPTPLEVDVKTPNLEVLPTADLQTTTSKARSTTTRPSARSGDLGLSKPMTVPSCNGSGIVVLANATDPATYANDIQRYLDMFPGSQYLRTDQSCPSLRQVSDSGTAIYAVFLPSGKSRDEICADVDDAGGDAYGKWLDKSTDPSSFITC